ncbi:CehA/McbA family metallohydrolase [Dasania marina]|uniref:CehA/McbA family metallohydrolase n=1 Tax=Dasania marina TaxID=471499 RepID=UPI0030D8B76E|tara:strand:- start:21207 stop:23417 length:2211 start_codon:yes stop_codon:yes gene_type:complete
MLICKRPNIKQKPKYKAKNNKKHLSTVRALAIATIANALSCSLVFAHGGDHAPISIDSLSGPRGLVDLDWQAKNINRTFTAGYPDSFGRSSFFRRVLPSNYQHQGKQCINANFVAFDINDSYAHNIDEIVEIELTFDANKTDSVYYGYDANNDASAGGEIKHTKGGEQAFYKTTLKLNRARFANRGMDGADFALTAVATYEIDAADQLSTFGLCDIAIKRSNTTKTDTKPANLSIQWRENNQPTAVRFGIYDQTGRAVLPSKDAIDIQFYEKTRKSLSLNNYQPKSQPWPHQNRNISYANDQYQTQLPAGLYTIVASKGPEYKVVNQQIEIAANSNNSITIDLQRWDNLPAKGWYSGDVHIHMNRNKPQLNASIMAMLQAEDVHVSNLLLMSNASDGHFDQYAYGKTGVHSKGIHSIVSGIEGPRTAQRGHAIALNIEKPILDQDNYFLYHQFMESYHQQKALNGYAHVGSEEFNASWGLALDVPFGLVDFVEIMQNSKLRLEFWYQFLGLGYKLAPAAGSDFPYFDQPGAVRSYAKTKTISTPSPQQWFDAVKAGNTYVSNGPSLEFSVNNTPMGGQLSLQNNKPLTIKAEMAINPDLDQIESLELVSCGKVIKRVEADGTQPTLSLAFELAANSSQWLAVRGYGRNYGLVHSAPIYIANQQGFSGCQDQVQELANTMLKRLDALSAQPIEVNRELEYWETSRLEQQYNSQLPKLKQRIELARKKYLDLQKAAAQ